MLEDLKDKVILVTGSSRGIGLATAKTLSSLGAKVILSSAKSEEELKSASAGVPNSDFQLADVTKDGEVKIMVDLIVKKYGRIDGLVNNAGGGGWATITDPDSEWQKSFDLDIMGAVHLCRYVMPLMEKQKSGVVVNVVSLWGVPGTAKPSISSYGVAKAGLAKLTENLAVQYAPNIRVNGVAPGWTKTKMLLDDFDKAGIKFMENNVLLKRLAEPEDIAKVIVFLLSNASAYITGQIISADGGYLLKRENIDG
ncbi:MAG: SDR family oxidoreductase [Candidatus Shapirobacteria bacterium]|jgi:NAD(P)-dependent dehydrogenase (short-subunit alcohol dehydrogenase family)